jgi:hypothetical protein
VLAPEKNKSPVVVVRAFFIQEAAARSLIVCLRLIDLNILVNAGSSP